MPTRCFGLMMAILLLWSNFLTGTSPDQDQPSIPVRRIWLDPDRPWFPWLQQGDWVTIARKEFEETLQNAEQQRQSERFPPQLLSAYYTARWNGQDLQGQAVWTLYQDKPLLSVYRTANWNLALHERPQWPNEPALAGLHQGQFEVYCQHQGQRELRLQWSRAGERYPEGMRFQLQMPSAPVVVIDIDVPRSHRLTWPNAAQQVSLLSANETADTWRWRITRSEGDQRDLTLLLEPVPTNTSPLSLSIPLQSRVEYRIDPLQSTFRYECLLTTGSDLRQPISWTIDPLVRVQSVTQLIDGQRAPIAWQLLPGSTTILTVSPPTQLPATLLIEGQLEKPTVDVRSNEWQVTLTSIQPSTRQPCLESKTLFIHPELELVHAEWGDTIPKARHEERRMIESSWESFELEPRNWLTPNPSPARLTLRPSVQRTVVTQNTWCLLHVTQSRCIVQLNWQQIIGSRNWMEVALPTGWRIDQVLVEPAHHALQWNWNEQAPNQPLQLLLQSALRPMESLQVWLILQPMQPLFTLGSAADVPLPQIVPRAIQGFRGQYHLALAMAKTTPEAAALLDASVAWSEGTRILSTTPTTPDKVKELLATTPYRWQGSYALDRPDVSGHVKLQPLSPKLNSKVHLSVQPPTLQYLVKIDPEQGTTPSIRCQFSANMPSLAWKTVKGSAQLSSWQRIDERHAVLQLDQPLTEPLELLGTGEWNPQSPLPLLWITHAGTCEGLVTLTSAKDARIQLTAEGKFERTSSISTEWNYAYDLTTTNARINQHDLGIAQQPSAVSIHDPQWTCIVEPAGMLSYEFDFLLDAPMDCTIAWPWPGPSHVSSVERDGLQQAINAHNGTDLQIRVNVGRHRYKIRAIQAMEPFHWWGSTALLQPNRPATLQCPTIVSRILIPERWHPIGMGLHPVASSQTTDDPNHLKTWRSAAPTSEHASLFIVHAMLPPLGGVLIGCIGLVWLYRHKALLLVVGSLLMVAGWVLSSLEVWDFWAPTLLWLGGCWLVWAALQWFATGWAILKGRSSWSAFSSLLGLGLLIPWAANSQAQPQETKTPRTITVFLLPGKKGAQSDEHVVLSAQDWRDLQNMSRSIANRFPTYLLLTTQTNLRIEADHAQLQSEWLVHAFQKETQLLLPWGLARLKQCLVDQQPAFIKPSPNGLAVTLNEAGLHRLLVTMDLPLGMKANEIQLDLNWPGAACSRCQLQWDQAIYHFRASGMQGQWSVHPQERQAQFELGGTTQTSWSWMHQSPQPPRLKSREHVSLDRDLQSNRLRILYRFEIAQGSTDQLSFLLPPALHIEQVQWMEPNGSSQVYLESIKIVETANNERRLLAQLSQRVSGSVALQLVGRWSPPKEPLLLLYPFVHAPLPWFALTTLLMYSGKRPTLEEAWLPLPRPEQVETRVGYLFLPERNRHWRLQSPAVALPALAYRALWPKELSEPGRGSYQVYFLNQSQLEKPLWLQLEQPDATVKVEPLIKLVLDESQSEFDNSFRVSFGRSVPLFSEIVLPAQTVLTEVRSPAIQRWYQVGDRCLFFWQAQADTKVSVQMQGWWMPTVNNDGSAWQAPLWQWPYAVMQGGRLDVQMSSSALRLQAQERPPRAGLEEDPFFFSHSSTIRKSYFIKQYPYQLQWKLNYP